MYAYAWQVPLACLHAYIKYIFYVFFIVTKELLNLEMCL